MIDQNIEITETTIRDLASIKCNYAAILFYLWIVLRYQDKKFTIAEVTNKYNRSRRTIFRYLSDLKEMDMIEKVENGKRHSEAKFKIMVVE